jgi:uncharacterized surface protein with fasciclin (FAS1) repeats
VKAATSVLPAFLFALLCGTDAEGSTQRFLAHLSGAESVQARAELVLHEDSSYQLRIVADPATGPISWSQLSESGRVVRELGAGAAYQPVGVRLRSGSFAGHLDAGAAAALRSGYLFLQIGTEGHPQGFGGAFEADRQAAERFTNVSSRARIDPAGDGEEMLIAGFVVEGSSKLVVARACGASLLRHGVSGAVRDAALTLYAADGSRLGSNDNWTSSDQRLALLSAGLAPDEGTDAALLGLLPPGAYTVVVESRSGPGVALAEVFAVQPQSFLDSLKSAGEFSLLLEAIAKAGMEEALRAPGPFTLFAPTDAAFGKLSSDQRDALFADPGRLASFLFDHLVYGEIPADGLAGRMVRAVSGKELNLVTVDRSRWINDSAVEGSLTARGGHIHALQSILR